MNGPPDAEVASRTLGDETWVDAGGGRSEPEPETALARGTEVGRYVVLEPVGRGAMGVVYAAYDPQLDRKVAIKVLRRRAGRSTELVEARLMREAQALARVSHPNVVAVHDVGRHEGQVFVAMEFVEGQTLGAWMKAQRRPWREVLRVFGRAGEGLASAHGHGLVHRDFKPENVMLGAGERVVVMDFGLARADGSESSERESLDTGGLESEPALSTDLTRTGSTMGTPAYMAPEQHLGLSVDARSDQFSFAVALFEALHGERPFAGDTLAALGIAIAEGEVREPPNASSVPTWVRKVVRRGLESDPQARWPDMPAMLGALRDDPGVRRRRGLTLAAGVVLVGGLAWGLASAGSEGPELCGGGTQRVAEVWADASRSELRDALASTPVAFAEDTAARTVDAIDEWTDLWAAEHREACEATHVRGEQSSDLMDRRMACLRDRLQSLATVVEVLSEADRAVAARAVQVVAELPSPTQCRGANLLSRKVAAPPDERTRAQVEKLRHELDLGRTLAEAGKPEAGLERVNAAVEAAAKLDYAPLHAEAAFSRGHVAMALGEYGAADEALSQAYFQAVEAGHDELAARSAAWLVYVVGYRRMQVDRGQEWIRHASAAALRVDEGGLLEARALHHAGVVADVAGDHELALEHYQRSYAIRIEQLEGDHPDVARSLNNLGNVYMATSRVDEGVEHYKQALAMRERIFGPDHPEVASSLNNVSLGLRAQGDYQGAIEALERAHLISTAAFGTLHPDTAQFANNLAAMCRASGKLDDARRWAGEALATRKKVLEPEHPDMGDSEFELGAVEEATGNHAEARLHYEAAAAAYAGAFDEGHPVRFRVDVRLAGITLLEGDAVQAAERLGRLVETGVRALPVDRARALVLLARARGREHPSTDELIEAARKLYASEGAGFRADIAAIEAWREGDDDAPLPSDAG